MNLVADLSAADDGRKRTYRMINDSAEEVNFLFHKKAGHHRKDMSHTHNGCMGTVGGTERIIYCYIAAFSQFSCEVLIISFFSFFKAKIFKKKYFSRLECLFHLTGFFPNA